MAEPQRFAILIVDDEQDLCESLAYVLEDFGFETSTATTTAQAYHQIMNGRVDIVLSDVRMPGENGVEMIRRVRKQKPHEPVFILMTGFTDISEKDALAAGAEVMLRKPVKLEQLQVLLERIRKQLQEKAPA
ncbi:response regulator [Oligoflexus tunisiensis]|uniref:response regulator n=1 Tax=Oligoflexus tunisiensis TaxID=708132 RepID=UPI00114D172F|nr:response regulator [Oligoflexus tunisiensis]